MTSLVVLTRSLDVSSMPVWSGFSGSGLGMLGSATTINAIMKFLAWVGDERAGSASLNMRSRNDWAYSSASLFSRSSSACKSVESWPRLTWVANSTDDRLEIEDIAGLALEKSPNLYLWTFFLTCNNTAPFGISPAKKKNGPQIRRNRSKKNPEIDCITKSERACSPDQTPRPPRHEK